MALEAARHTASPLRPALRCRKGRSRFSMGFFQQLEARSKDLDTLVCVGLDPDYKKHRVEDIALFCKAIVEATAPYAACFKPNIAFFEQHGVEGMRALEQTLAAIPSDVPVIGDVKRGDMGNTAE